jgi:hypothetical protein
MSDDVVRLTIDPGRCVLCGGPNDCLLARDEARDEAGARSGDARGHAERPDREEACWCVGRVFPESLQARATAHDGGARCICRACLDDALRAPDA